MGYSPGVHKESDMTECLGTLAHPLEQIKKRPCSDSDSTGEHCHLVAPRLQSNTQQAGPLWELQGLGLVWGKKTPLSLA